MMSATFRTQYQPHARVFHHPGKRMKVKYTPVYDERGNLDLQPVGEEDLYDYIQSHAESCDIHVILDRFASGEKDVLSQVQGFYADFADMPSTYQEVLNAVIAGENAFNTLPAEVKARFGHNFASWLIAMESPDFLERSGFLQPDRGDARASAAGMPTASPVPAPAGSQPSEQAPSGNKSSET